METLERKENVGLNRPGKGGESEAQVNGINWVSWGGQFLGDVTDKIS